MNHLLIAFLVCAAIWANPIQAQPDMEPCGRYTPIFKYDLNSDDSTDVVIYLGSEGTDDVPSSSGSCFYQLAFVQGGILGTVSNQSPYAQFGDTVLAQGPVFHSPRAFYFTWLMQTDYGRDPSGQWTTFHETDSLYLGYFLPDGRDTLVGWLKISIDLEEGKAVIDDYHLDEVGTVVIGEKIDDRKWWICRWFD